MLPLTCIPMIFSLQSSHCTQVCCCTTEHTGLHSTVQCWVAASYSTDLVRTTSSPL